MTHLLACYIHGDNVVGPPAGHLLLRRRVSKLFSALEAGVDGVLSADDRLQAEEDGRLMMRAVLAGTRFVAEVSGADDAAGSSDDRADGTLGAAIDRLLVTHDVAGKMKEL